MIKTLAYEEYPVPMNKKLVYARAFVPIHKASELISAFTFMFHSLDKIEPNALMASVISIDHGDRANDLGTKQTDHQANAKKKILAQMESSSMNGDFKGSVSWTSVDTRVNQWKVTVKPFSTPRMVVKGGVIGKEYGKSGFLSFTIDCGLQPSHIFMEQVILWIERNPQYVWSTEWLIDGNEYRSTYGGEVHEEQNSEYEKAYEYALKIVEENSDSTPLP